MVIATVPSFVMDGTRYEIERGVTKDQVYCDCPAFTFGGKVAGEQSCKHIAIYQTAVAAHDKCSRVHPPRRSGICTQCLIDLLATMAADLANERKKRRKKKEAKT